MLGAGLFAANLSTTFRLRKFGMTDKVPYTIKLHMEGDEEGAAGGGGGKGKRGRGKKKGGLYGAEGFPVCCCVLEEERLAHCETVQVEALVLAVCLVCVVRCKHAWRCKPFLHLLTRCM